MSKLICNTCKTKVDVVHSKDYVTCDGNIYCDLTCKGLYGLEDGLRRVKTKKKSKVKKEVKYQCPNCNTIFRYRTFNKECPECRGKFDNTVDTRLRVL